MPDTTSGTRSATPAKTEGKPRAKKTDYPQHDAVLMARVEDGGLPRARVEDGGPAPDSDEITHIAPERGAQ